MLLSYDSTAPKKATNLSVNSDLLSQAKDLHLNISSVLESALAEKVLEERQKAWLAENQDAIARYNKTISEEGAFSDKLRSF
ncbi:MAG: type II toxin-antitoxin system CcdA family antitoxin [Spirochaetota bacterium]